MAVSPYDLVILDSDGVLVDSEHLTHQTLIDMLHELGVGMDIDEALHLFKGGKMSECIDEIERRRGQPMEEDFEQSFRRRCDERYRTELSEVAGVSAALDALDALGVATCVASNGPHSKLQTTLGVVGFLERFEGRIFSAYTARIFKPDPHLFLSAARGMQAAPERCLVVEDSIHGVQAAVAAGMHVLAYVPGEDSEGLEAAGATLMRSMTQLPQLVARR